MSNKANTYGSMGELVGAERVNVVNSGTVKDSDAQSKSTLTERESAAKPRSSTAPESRKGDRLGKHFSTRPAMAQGKGGQDVSVAEDAEAQPTPRRHASVGRRTSGLVAATAANELDDTPEFEGASTAYANATRASALNRHIQKIRASRKAKTAGAHEHSAKAAGKGSKGAKSAAKAQQESAKAKAMVATHAAEGTGAAAATAERAAATKGLGAAVASAAAPVAGVLAGILAFVLCVLVVSQLISALFGFWKNEAEKQKMEGLPPYITYEMVEAALECQEEYGHPAGCTIAQIICESGQGDHMSQLATRDHNLFGIKWASSFASCPEVTGKSSWVTGEEYDGQNVTITAYFTVFKSDVDCIKFRSRVFLQQSHFKNQPAIKEAIANHDSDKMAEGLKAGGWATSSSYVESLKSIMDTYNLRRFDTMSLETLKNMGQARATVVQAAYSQIGVPYVWGGSSPGVGLDCSGLTQYCYRQAGINIPRNSEDQASYGTKIPVSQAKPGDILWRPGHVAIYVGDNKYVHEPHSGSSCREATGANYFTSAIQIII